MAMWGALFILLTMGAYLGADVGVTWHDMAVCFVSGGLLTAGGATCFMQGARYVPAAVLAFLSLTETVLAPIWAWIGYQETPSRIALAGGGIVLCAIVVETAIRVRRARRAGARARGSNRN